jgi:hypothetical protein
MPEVLKTTRALCLVLARGCVLAAVAVAISSPPAIAEEQAQARTALPSHVLPALQHAVAASAADTDAPLTITLVLKREDEAGFQKYLHDVYDPAAPDFRHFLTPLQIAERFGPTQQSYRQVADFLSGQGLAPALGSVNRLTLTVDAARVDVERAFGVQIGDCALGKRMFFANRQAPTLPSAVAEHVDAVLGLSNLAQATRPSGLTQGQPKPDDDPFLAYTCKLSSQLDGAEERIGYVEKLTGVEFKGSAALSFATTVLHYQCAADELNLLAEYAGNAGGAPRPAVGSASPNSASSSGGGQTIALAEFDSYYSTDVLAFLNLIGYPQRMSQLSNQLLGAGPNFTMQGESEVLLDIDTTLSLAPGATVIAYEWGFRGQGTFQTMFNAMIGAGVDVISNSWAYCEDQTTLADVQSLDSVLQSAQVSGITVLTGAGDSGSNCLDGAANTIVVPADSPNITAVGGTTASPGLDGTYGSETWWDGSQHTPPSGQGGFGTSRFFARPAYQNGLNAQAQRSIPDVSAPADPAQGVLICQFDAGGCPSNFLYGGTSIAAPIWAAAVAVMNQRIGNNLGFLNAQIYPLANGSAFHSAASMGSDFAHVGLGSPNFGELKRLLTGGTHGAPSLVNSAVVAFPPQVFADGSSVAGVSVIVFDASYNTLPNQSVTLSAGAGSHAVITVVDGNSTVGNGAARFTLTDTVAETVTLTARIGGNALTNTAQVVFVGPPATAGGIVASPTTQTADGTSTSTITVSLEDAQHQAAPGKQVRLAQSGSSVILGVNPRMTDSNGEAQFDVTDQVQETAVYTAVDVSDGDLSIPQTASVTFSGAAANACGYGATPLAGPGYALSVYASGFPVQNNLTFGGITLNGCAGASGIAFDGAQNLFVSDYVTGDVYKLPPGGGVAGAGNKITATAIGPSLGGMTFGNDGKLYAVRVATSDSATTGAVLQIDTASGTPTVVAGNIPCPSNIATDPLSGDLFVSDFCFGSAQESDSIWRIASPGGPSPVTSVYASSGIPPNGSVNFTADGSLYVVYGYRNFGGLFAGIERIGATNGAQPPPVQPIGVSSTFAALPLGTNPSGGGAQSVIASTANVGGYAHSVAVFDMTVTPPVFSGTTLVQSDIGSVKILGADGCVYFANGNAVYKLSNADGSCPLLGLTPDPSVLLSPDIDPNTVVQGTSLRFEVSFPHTPDVPIGTPIIYEVSGANPLLGSTSVGFGSIGFSYSGRFSGSDTVVASAVIGGNEIHSNPVRVTWASGKHVTFIDLNTSTDSGTIGSSQQVSATLFDQSTVPPAPIVGATLDFALTGQACSAITDANGTATCRIAVSALNECTLSASYDGDTQYLASTASLLFAVGSIDVLFANGFEIPQAPGCSLY